jgi:hypothetical protein
MITWRLDDMKEILIRAAIAAAALVLLTFLPGAPAENHGGTTRVIGQSAAYAGEKLVEMKMKVPEETSADQKSADKRAN